jgi:Holliday junction resolvase RusA-like endonuclease
LIEIILAGVPVGKGRPRFVKSTGRAFTPEKTVRFEDRLSIVAQEAMGERPPMSGPVDIEIEIRMPVPLSKPKRFRDQALAGLIWPTKKPDWDNLAKTIDALNMIVWVDDAQIVKSRVTKIYHEAPAFVARVREIGSVFE